MQTVSAQLTLTFQGNEVGDPWGFTTTGANASALTQANATPNKVSGTKSIVAGGTTGGGSCYDGGSGNGTVVNNKITFQPVSIATSNEQIRTLSFHWGSRFPVCAGTGWDVGEDLTFTPIIDGIAQTPITLAVGNVNADFNIKLPVQKYSYTIPTCVNTFAFELNLPTNRRDELLFVDDVMLKTPAMNVPLTIPLTVTGDANACIGGLSNVSTNALPGVSYDWSGLPIGATFTTPNNTSASHTMVIDWAIAAAGTYQVKVKPRKTQCGIDVFGAEVSFQVIVNSNPVLTTSPASSICAGDAITLTASGATTYSWNNGLGTSSAVIVTPTATTTYQVTGFNGTCSSTETIVITVNPAAVSAGSDITICEGNQVTLTASGGNNFIWDQGVVNGIAFTPTTTSIYTVTSTGSCAGTDQVTVTVEEAPSANFSSDVNSGCLPLSIQFENLTIGNNTYLWSFDDGTNSNLDDPNHTFTSIGCKNVTLLATSPNGCTNTFIADNFICVVDGPNVQFTTDITEITSDNSTVEFTNQTTGATSFVWNFGDGNLSTDYSTSHTFDPFSLSNQFITLTATNDAGCSATAMTIIYFNAVPSIYVPNAFTPNGDEANQIFIPKFGDRIDPTKYHIAIFNRWGGIVFESADMNIGWDGTFKGQAVQEGEYIWKMRYGIVEGVDQIEKLGHVNLLR